MAFSHRRPQALIVDGQPFAGMVASDILRETGFDTFHAYDAADAIALLRSHPGIQVLVTEADLPGLIDGVELSQRVSAERPQVRLLVTEGMRNVQTSDVPEGARVLKKPFSSAELRMLVAGVTLLEDC